MKWILVPLLWLLALAVAVAVLWRLWRGQNVVLRGRWSPRVVRMVAVILVVLGVGVEKGIAHPIDLAEYKVKQGRIHADDALPATINAATLERWLRLQQPHEPWRTFKQEYTRLDASGQADAQAVKNLLARLDGLPSEFTKVLRADLSARAAGQPAPVNGRELLAALDDAERNGYYDHWLCAYLWRKGRPTLDGEDRAGAVELYARLHRHARVTNTLIRAQARVKPMLLEPRAWRSKAGPARGEMEIHWQALGEMLAAVRTLHAKSDAGTWERDGIALFRVARDSAPFALLHGGGRQVQQTEQTFTLGRLDLIETPPGDKPVVLEHPWLGRVVLPADRLVSVCDLPRCLPDEGKARLAKAIGAALDGDDHALILLEQALPLAHAALREHLVKPPRVRPAARLRMILTLFDDAAMPPPIEREAVQGRLLPGLRGFAPADGGR